MAAVTAMLEARSVALVGASPRRGSLGERMITEMGRSDPLPRTYLVNPRYDDIGGVRCYHRLRDVPGPVDLVLLGVPDAALEDQLTQAAARGDRSAVIFGSAHDMPGHAMPGACDLPGTCDLPGACDLPGPPGRLDLRNPFDLYNHCGLSTTRLHSGRGQPDGLRARLAAIARSAGMALCGAGCMGFVNVVRGLRAIGYIEPDPLPAGPVALVTHSGSVFSTLLRARRGFGFSLAVSSGQELVTTAGAYARYALQQPETKVLALVLETIRDAPLLRGVLTDAAAAGVPVVLLAAGSSAGARALVEAHSGALAAGDGAWEALASAHGVHRVRDLPELADTLELFTVTRPAGTSPSGAPHHRADFPANNAGKSAHIPGQAQAAPRGIATVHDSGLERAHVADLAAELGVPFAELTAATRARLAAVLDPGLEPANPLDVWGTGRDAEALLTDCLSAMTDDPAVSAVAFAVDLVPEFDGDRSYEAAVLAAAQHAAAQHAAAQHAAAQHAAAQHTGAGPAATMVAVLAGLPAAVDPATAGRLRAAGVPVLEGTRSGLLALRHLLDHSDPEHFDHSQDWSHTDRTARAAVPPAPGPAAPAPAGWPTAGRRRRWSGVLAGGPLNGEALLEMLRDYGIAVVRATSVTSRAGALTAAAAIGYPVVLKTDNPSIAHKSDAGGVVTGLTGAAALAAAYDGLAARLGPRALVCETAAPGTELMLGIAADPSLGPLVVVGAGGVLTELLADRAVALPPVDRAGARRLIGRLRAAPLLAGARGQPPADLDAVADAITALSVLAAELGGQLAAFDVNPLICGPSGAVAVDALAVPRASAAPGRER